MEVPPGAFGTSGNVNMHYAIIPSGPFTLPEGYQCGSPVVYIYYDSRRVTKPIKLHLPHWYGGRDHTRDGLSFAIASHSLKGERMYHFKLLSGGKFSDESHYGVVEIGGHCSLFTKVFKLGATVNCQAVCLEKEEGHQTVCDIAVTYASPYWLQVRLINEFHYIAHSEFINYYTTLVFVYLADLAGVQTWLEGDEVFFIQIQIGQDHCHFGE